LEPNGERVFPANRNGKSAKLLVNMNLYLLTCWRCDYL